MAACRLVIAMMKHETNTFSPVRTDWRRFEDWGVYFGAAARRAYEGTAMPMGAYLALAREIGAEAVTPVAAEAMPGGPVTHEAYERLSDALLERIRALAPDLPIAVTCDLHCNLTERMVRNCTALIGYKTYPHVDMHEVGERVGRIVLRAMRGEARPAMVWGRRPLLAQTLRMGTDDEPMR